MGLAQTRKLIHIKFDMTHYTRADLDMADRHIAQGEGHILRQEALLTGMRSRGQSVDSAETLLALFNSTQISHITHRAAIARALEAEGL